MTPNTQKRVARIHAALRNQLKPLARTWEFDRNEKKRVVLFLCAVGCRHCDAIRERQRKRATALVMRAMSRTWGAYVLKAGPL